MSGPSHDGESVFGAQADPFSLAALLAFAKIAKGLNCNVDGNRCARRCAGRCVQVDQNIMRSKAHCHDCPHPIVIVESQTNLSKESVASGDLNKQTMIDDHESERATITRNRPINRYNNVHKERGTS